jgi:hypothetical protein
MDTMDGMDKNGLLNGQWTMDDGLGWLSSRRDQQARPQICVSSHPSKQQPYKIFVFFRVFSLLKSWIYFA